MALLCWNRSCKVASVTSLTGGGWMNFSRSLAAALAIPLVKQFTRSGADNSLTGSWGGASQGATFQVSGLVGPTFKLSNSMAASISVWIL